jgi:3-phenylpropionate/trans-cinnamate dioxygenase ferredoxin subunit
MAFVFAAKLNQLPEGAIIEVTVEGRLLVLINCGGQIRCLDAICSHEEVSLAGGFCENNCIVCPAHGAMFDLDSGAVKAPPAVVPIKTYPIKIEGDNILVSL